MITSMCLTVTVLDWWNTSRHPLELTAPVYVSPIPAPAPQAAAPSPPVVSPVVAAPAVSNAPVVIPPKLLKRVEPKYTSYAQSHKIQGTVGLTFYVTPNGNVRTIKVIHHLETDLDRNAIEALSHWRYSPGTVDGRPATVRMREDIEFRLR
jgi:periplasmic protein TonB